MRAARLAVAGAIVTFVGVLVSGPLVLLAIPTRPWVSARDFAMHYERIDALAFYGGFVLLAGLVLFVGSLHALAPKELRARTSTALVFLGAFASLALFNYAVQTAFVPQLVAANDPSNDSLLAGMAMSNPASLAWCLEMYAYGALGAATWLVAAVFAGRGVARATRIAFVANGVVSIATALLTSLSPGWALTLPGLVGYLVWNALVLAMCVLATIALLNGRARRGANIGGELAQRLAERRDVAGHRLQSRL